MKFCYLKLLNAFEGSKQRHSALSLLKLHLIVFVFSLFIPIRTSLELQNLLFFVTFQYLRFHLEVTACLQVRCTQEL